MLGNLAQRGVGRLCAAGFKDTSFLLLLKVGKLCAAGFCTFFAIS